VFYYHFKQLIRDSILFLGNPFNLAKFSPQHKKLIELGPFDTVLHIGANTGQEMSLYKYIGLKRAVWVEPDEKAFFWLKLRSKFYKIETYLINEFISNKSDEYVTYYRFNRSGANSSFKPLKEFLNSDTKRYVKSVKRISTINIEEALIRYKIPEFTANTLLVLDTQGSELDILKGFKPETFTNIRVVMCEFSMNQYLDTPSNDNLRKFLINKGYSEILKPIRSSDDGIYSK
jgi:FkbM family methyltransferase